MLKRRILLTVAGLLIAGAVLFSMYLWRSYRGTREESAFRGARFVWIEEEPHAT